MGKKRVKKRLPFFTRYQFYKIRICVQNEESRNQPLNHRTDTEQQKISFRSALQSSREGGAFIQNVKTDEQNTGIGNSKMKHINS